MTNFDITRYDVEKILESTTLLSGEHARRNKAIDVEREEPSSQGNSSRDVVENDTSTTASGRKMDFHSVHPAHDSEPVVENLSSAQSVDDLEKLGSSNHQHAATAAMATTTEGAPGFSLTYITKVEWFYHC